MVISGRAGWSFRMSKEICELAAMLKLAIRTHTLDDSGELYLTFVLVLKRGEIKMGCLLKQSETENTARKGILSIKCRDFFGRECCRGKTA